MRTSVLKCKPEAALFWFVIQTSPSRGSLWLLTLLVQCKWLLTLQYLEPNVITAPITFCSSMVHVCLCQEK